MAELIDKKRTFFIAALIILFALLVYDRIFILRFFASFWVDDDQALMWYASGEFLKGRFHQPHFFGQSYNTMIEALLGAPFVALGVPHEIAIPGVAILLSLLPFLLAAFYVIRKGEFVSAFFVLSVPVLLPLNYELITSIPRGFVPGIATASLGAFLVLIKKESQWNTALCAFLLVLGISINPNALLFSVPAFVLIAWPNFKDRKFWFSSFLGAFAALCLHILGKSFYYFHPDYDYFRLRGLHFGTHLLLEAVQNLASYFGDLAPIIPGNAYLLIGVFIFLGVLGVFKRRYEIGISILVAICITMLSLGFKKVHSGEASVFYPEARFFLALPPLLAFVISVFPEIFNKNFLRQVLLMSAIFLYVGFQYIQRPSELHSVNNHLLSVRKAEVRFMHTNELINTCARVKTLFDENHAEVVVFPSLAEGRILAYGCAALLGDSYPTFYPRFDRRRWVIEQEKQPIRTRILVYGVIDVFVENAQQYAKEIKELSRSPRAYLLITDAIALRELSLKLFGEDVDVKRERYDKLTTKRHLIRQSKVCK